MEMKFPMRINRDFLIFQFHFFTKSGSIDRCTITYSVEPPFCLIECNRPANPPYRTTYGPVTLKVQRNGRATTYQYD